MYDNYIIYMVIYVIIYFFVYINIKLLFRGDIDIIF